MKLKVTLRSSDRDQDLLLTLDGTATISDLTRALARVQHTTNTTLTVWVPGDPQPHVLNPRAAVHETSLASGCLVALTPAPTLRSRHQASIGPAPDPPRPFLRSPRVEPTYTGRELTAPDLAPPRDPPRFPVLAVISPVLLGASLFAVTQQPTTLLFVALSPLIMLGTWVDARTQQRRAAKAAAAQFTIDRDALRNELDTERAVEQAARCAEYPDLTSITTPIVSRIPLLWTRKPEHTPFLDIRFGLGSLPSHTRVTRPPRPAASQAEWRQLTRLLAPHDTGPRVPVVENLDRAGARGIAGASEYGTSIARAWLLQLAGLHSPADLVIPALGDSDAVTEWSWLKWLPHVAPAHSPIQTSLGADSPAATALLADLEGLVEARRHGRGDAGQQVRSRLDEHAASTRADDPVTRTLPAPIVVLLTVAAPRVAFSRLIVLGEVGASHGVYLIWFAPEVRALPVICRTYLDVTTPGTAYAGFVRTGRPLPLESVDTLNRRDAAHLARLLAPLTDLGAPTLDETDLPHTVNFLTLHDTIDPDEPTTIVTRWAQHDTLTARWTPGHRRRVSGLRAVVGQGPTEPCALDLRRHGPHALVGGTTGSGKSEFLQTWILSLATAYSPEHVTFLLVDYKGGAAFADCVQLPQTVGLVTDLTGHLVHRALTSLRAELSYRERLLQTKQAKDIDALAERSDPETPPALVIVVDEFAALVTEVPDFIDGVVDVAQRGHSLGLHLILATQRPAGVIRDNLRANTNLRVALRMADETDSLDVLGMPRAAHFDPGTPGRAAAKLGSARVYDFQTAYLGGRSGPYRHRTAEITITDFPFGLGESLGDLPLEPTVPTPAPPNLADDPPRDIERLVSTVSAAHHRAQLRRPRRPGLDPLPPLIDLASLPPAATSTGARPCQSEHPLGLIDEPELQRQRPFTADVEHAGNLVIVGTSGSGKSATLRTIAAAASHPGAGPTVVYGLDFAGGALRSLTVLPTVGSIIDASDGERVARLIRYLSDVADERTALFSTVAAGSLGEYRTLAPHQPSHASPTLAPLQPPHASPTPAPHQPSHAPPTPAPTHYAPAASTAHPALAAPTPESVARILLLVDGMAAFRTAHEFTDRGRLFETFTRLATIGRGLGIHTVVTTDRSGAIPPSLHAAFPQRLTLRLPSPADYALANIPEDMLANVPPGRGFYNGHECQIAVPGGSTEPSVQAATLARFGDQLRATGAPPAPEIARLPELIPLAPLPPQVAGRPTIGVADDTLQPIGMPLVGLCVITGPFGSGRTTAVRCLVTTAMTARPTCTRYLLVARGSALADVIEWTEASRNADQADELASRLAGELEAAAHRPLAPTLTPLIVVENAGDFEGLPAEASIARLLKAARRADVPTIVEADTVTLTSVWQIHAELKTARSGIVLQPEETDGNSLFRVQFPRVTRADFPVGRGLLVENGQIRRVQVALP